MSICSYCYKNVSPDQECFGWREARNYCGISGALDPKRLEAKKIHDQDKASRLVLRAGVIRAEAEQEARRLEKEAERLLGT